MIDHNKLYSAQRNLNKLKTYLDEFPLNEPMYETTQEKLELMVEDMKECQSKLSKIISSNHIRKSKVNTSITKELIQLSNTLQLLSNHDFEYEEIKQCCQLLHRWYHTRFIECKSNFVYNPKFLPEWICSFILLFGYYMHKSDIETFESILREWFLDIKYNKSNFAIPKEVWEIKNSNLSEYFTLEAVMIYDCIIDCGLYTMCEDNHEGVIQFTYNAVSRIVRDRNESLRDDVRRHIAHSEEYLQQLNFTPVRR